MISMLIRDQFWLVKYRLVPALLMFLLVVVWTDAYGANQPGFACDTGTVQPNRNWTQIMCWAQPGTKYVRDDATWAYPSGWMMETYPTRPLVPSIRLQGWGDPRIDGGAAAVGLIAIDTVYSHYPLDSWPKTRFGNADIDAGGVLHGKNANGERLVATLNEIASRGYNIDRGAGIYIGGNCYGGRASVTQSLILPDPYWQQQITQVFGLLPGMTADPPFGYYFKYPQSWDYLDGTKYDITQAQHSKHTDKLRNIYYRFMANSMDYDEIGFNQNFLREVCDKGKIACYATWGRLPHQHPDYEMPAENDESVKGMYSGPGMVNRLDQVLPIFTRSTANWYKYGEQLPRGHYNLGLEWLNAGFVDTTDKLSAPIRYRQHKNLGPTIPDQPTTAKFDLTLRHPNTFRLTKGKTVRYTIGDRVGHACVAIDGEVSIGGVSLGTGDAYTHVVLEHTDIEGCPIGKR